MQVLLFDVCTIKHPGCHYYTMDTNMKLEFGLNPVLALKTDKINHVRIALMQIVIHFVSINYTMSLKFSFSKKSEVVKITK